MATPRPFTSPDRPPPQYPDDDSLDPESLFLLDTFGFLHLENVLSPPEVDAANAALDRHADQFDTSTPVGTLSRNEPGLEGSSVRAVAGWDPRYGPLGWTMPDRDPFRAMLAHKAIVPVLNAILGKGFRMDHAPDVILAQPGAEGHRLHGGMIPFNPAGYYMFSGGEIRCGCVVVAWQLSDTNVGDGEWQPCDLSLL